LIFIDPAINEKILSLHYGELSAQILTVDAQNSFNEGVLILVTGYLTGKDSLRHKFTQSFFLAPQDKGYFVLNDAFRYVDDGSQSFVNDVGVPLTPDPATELSEVVDGEVYNLPENVQASIEEEEMPVGEVVDEVSDEWQLVAESNSETEETPKKSYASIVKVMKESPAAFSSPTYAPRRSVSRSQEQPVIAGPPPPPLVSETPISSTNANENSSNKDYEGVQFVIVDF
ncbi:nuclear transport factor 2-like, partial [Quercus lobata]|uniref:nuclear transport factor 2-like n=1 Tax=Quercus lobata TaxID=97700 RepID=UPI0012463C1D